MIVYSLYRNRFGLLAEFLDFPVFKPTLNEKQLEAVMSNEGALLVIAGAGSGKTKTLTYRVARLIEDGTPPNNILLLTFTKKAAHEMLSRASLVLDERCEKVAGGTFHSFANIILRKYASELKLKNNFTIMILIINLYFFSFNIFFTFG